MGRDTISARAMVDGAMQQCARHGFLCNQWQGELTEVCLQLWDLHPTAMLEIGVQAGGWAFVVRQFCGVPLHYIGVDVAEHNEWPHCSALMRESGVKINRILASSQSPATVELVKAALRESGRNDVDVLHIDGDHAEDAALRDFDLYSPLVRAGGLIIMHDVGSSKGPRAALNTILSTDRAKRICEARTVIEQHWEWRDRIMGVAMLRIGG